MELETTDHNHLFEPSGFLIRRLQQIAVAVCTDEMSAGGLDITPVQYAALRTVQAHPGLDQAELLLHRCCSSQLSAHRCLGKAQAVRID